MVRRRMGFDEAARHFEVYCRAKGLAESTRWTYELALGRLRAYLSQERRPPRLPSRQDLRALIGAMLQEGLSKGTIRVRMRSARVFCNFLVSEGVLEASPMDGVAIPKVPMTHPEILSAGEVTRLLHATRKGTWYGIRNHAMIATFCDTGLRLSELIGLDAQDVDLHALSIRVRNGKGSKERRVYMGRTLARALRRWMDRHPFCVGADACFCTRNGRRLDKRNVARIIERASQRAGFRDRRVYPHLLRHTFATHFIKNGGDPFSLQRLLGHADIKTTMIYVNLAGVDLGEAHAKASPVDRLSSP